MNDDDLVVGRVYRLGFPGIAARVLPNPPRTTMTGKDGERCWLVESVFLKHRWWVTRYGEPNNHRSPWMITPALKRKQQAIRAMEKAR